MPKQVMRDLVVLIPGITGSVLSQGGKNVWTTSRIFGDVLNPFGGGMDVLALPPHDSEEGPPDDGIRATALIQDFHAIPGLCKIDGYTQAANMITDNFDVIQGSLDEKKPANFIPYPYDWRITNRVSACRLRDFISVRLALWREWSHWQDAKLILVAHSMGGLVSRYYLEVLEGWRDCRALVTFGTPYRGSLDAVNYVANGYKKVFLNVTDVMRSFPSVYELMPIYKALKVGANDWRRVGEMDRLPHLNNKYAAAALSFHREIEQAVESHRTDAEYLTQGYRIFPYVGVDQPTLQSAELHGDTIRASQERPTWLDSALEGGDGTVPRASATPIELSSDYRETFFAERHSSLQNNKFVLHDLYHRLRQLQSKGFAEVRGTWKGVDPVRGSLSIELDDLYLRDEPVRIRAHLVGGEATDQPPHARLEPFDGTGKIREADLFAGGDGWELELVDLEPGRYRVTVSLEGPKAPTPVHDVFEVSSIV